MIRLIHGHERSAFPREIDAMHRIRRKVFHERMGWDVSVIRHWEIDGFDVLDPLYLLSVNERGAVTGGLRLLPTTGLTMINDIFSVLLPEGAPVLSPRIWESSRFAVDHEADVPIGPKGLSRATAELGLGMNEVGEIYGLTHIVTVYDALMHRVLRRAGCAGEPIGEPKRIGSVLTYAVFFEIGEATEAALRDASGITGSVLETRHEKKLQLEVA
jgi:N-acyl-L-homoserine lactone synthetase